MGDQQIMIHRLLAMFSARPFVYTRFGPQGSVAIVRAYNEKYVDIMFRSVVCESLLLGIENIKLLHKLTKLNNVYLWLELIIITVLISTGTKCQIVALIYKLNT